MRSTAWENSPQRLPPMQHEFTLLGHAFRLRPIGDADAAFVVALRNDPALNQYLHATSASIENQVAWFADYYARTGDYYFVIERADTGVAEGVISIYDIAVGVGEWGRWILKPGSLAAVESAWLIYRMAFEQLALASIFCRTVADNAAVVSFHDSCGIPTRRVLPAHFLLGGKKMDAVEHRMDTHSWAQIAPRLERLAAMTARRITRG